MTTKHFGRLLAAGFIAMTLTSCYTTTTCVGNMTPEALSVPVMTVKNHHLIYGLVPIKDTDLKDSKYIGNRKNYKVQKNVSIVDGILSWITFGIYTPTTTTYYVPYQGK